MVLATCLVLLVPNIIVWGLRSKTILTSTWGSIGLAIALSFVMLFAGNAYWRRRNKAASVPFSDLLVWGWIRRAYIEHKISATYEALTRLDRSNDEQRMKLLARLADALDAEDVYLDGHSRRVARHAAGVAQQMRLSRHDASTARTAAAIHDIGKLRIPRDIVMAPRPLTDAEFATMRRHAVEGGDMLRTIGNAELGAIVEHHHERFDGTGYPSGLRGTEIPLGSRIIAVPDTFDAITSARPYRPARRHQDALDILDHEAGKQFDPEVVHAFVAYYTGRRGIVLWSFLLQRGPRVLQAGALGLATATVAAVTVSATQPSTAVPNLAARASSPVVTHARSAASRRPGKQPARRRAPAPAVKLRARPLTSRSSASVARPLSGRPRTHTPAGPSSPTPSPRRSTRSSPHPRPPTRAVTGSEARPVQPTSVVLSPLTPTPFAPVANPFTEPTTAPLPPTPSPSEPSPTETTPITTPTVPTTPTTSTTPTTTTPTTPTTPTEATPTPPANPDQCKNGGWLALGYKNQGECIAASHG